MPTAQQSAQEILSLFVGAGARPGRTFPISVGGPPATVTGFPGAIESQFLNAGNQTNAPYRPPSGSDPGATGIVNDLLAGLAYAVEQGWLSLGTFLPGAGNGSIGLQNYVLEQSGFAEAGGTAPSQSASAQQLINVAAALNGTPDGAQYKLENMATSFVGTVGENTFEPEDLIPAYGFAVASGWVRPIFTNIFRNVFSLTAAGVAQAA